jgi:hypothetical protein
MSVGDGTTGSHGKQIRQALPDLVQDLDQRSGWAAGHNQPEH